jgi:hypothetical protein
MNERIRELAEQAEQYANEQNDKYGARFKTEYDNKFAELIVKECIGIVEKQRARMSYGPTFVIVDIKQHFGVEE